MSIWLFLLFVLPGVSPQIPILRKMLEQWQMLLAPHVIECMYESHATEQMVNDAFLYGNSPNERRWKCNLKCLGYKVGVFNPETGDIDVEQWAAKFGLDRSLAEKCAEFDISDPCEKAYNAVNCVLENFKYG